MEGKTLFEIPVYSMSREEFDGKWKAKRDALYKQFIQSGHSESSAQQGVSDCYYPRWLWKYNQIAGYIKISVTKCDVLFDLYCSMDKKYCLDSKTKHFIEDWSINGAHFYVGEKSDKEIKEEIRFWLKEIEKDHLHRFRKKFYVDYSTFNNIFNFVNIREIIDNTL